MRRGRRSRARCPSESAQSRSQGKLESVNLRSGSSVRSLSAPLSASVLPGDTAKRACLSGHPDIPSLE
jgi:hypothetical protein